jgi:hypothetical protein
MNDLKNAVVSGIAWLGATAWAAEPPLKVSLIGRPVPAIDSLPEGPCCTNGCMECSMNGRPLPLDAPEMKAFTSYIAFPSLGVTVGAQIEGAAVLQSAAPNRRAEVAAGSVA